MCPANPPSSPFQVGPGFASASIINESPWRFDFINANSGSYPVTPWATATVPVSPGDSWYLSPVSALVTGNNYIIPPGVTTMQVVVQYSTRASVYSIRELFTVSSTMLPDDFTFGTQVTAFSINFTAVNQTLPMLEMTAGNIYSLLYCIFSVNPPGSNSILIQGVSSNGTVVPIDQVWTSTPLQSIIVPLFLVSQPSTGTNQLEIECTNFATGFEVYGSIISRIGAPSNVTPWLT